MTTSAAAIVPRYEFRAFAPGFGRVIDEIRTRAGCEGIRESLDTYLVTAAADSHNVKLRYDQLDVKQLVAVRQGLEQWRPLLKLNFPISATDLKELVFPVLGVSAPPLLDDAYDATALVDDVVWPHPEVRPAQVFKRRFHFTIDDCMVEIAELLVNGAAIQSVAVEASEVPAVIKVRENLGLAPYENVNYLLALKRILALAPMPAPSWRL